MLNVKRLFAVAALLCISSCSTNKLIGSWEFIEVYEGVIPKVDTLKNKQNQSKWGTGVLEFYSNRYFVSMDQRGRYQNEGKWLKMKYNNSKDTTRLKISYINKDYLLLSSTSEKPNTWFYKRRRDKK